MAECGESKTNMNIEPVIGEYAFWTYSMSNDDSNIKYVLVKTKNGDEYAECHYSSRDSTETSGIYNRGIILQVIDNSFIKKSYPPKVGEYGYFDGRIKEEDYYKTINSEYEWLISTSKSSCLGCHYSIIYDMPSRNFVTNQGKITEVLKKIN